MSPLLLELFLDECVWLHSRTNTQTGHITTAANDDDDWKEGCF